MSAREVKVYCLNPVFGNLSVFSKTHLGSNFDCTGNVKKEIMIRIGKATSAFKSLNKIWNCKLYSIKTKLRIFNSNVVSILTYASESWKMTKDIESKLNAFGKCL